MWNVELSLQCDVSWSLTSDNQWVRYRILVLRCQVCHCHCSRKKYVLSPFAWVRPKSEQTGIQKVVCLTSATKCFYILHNALLFHIQCVFPRFTNSQRKDTKILVRFSYWEWSTFGYSSTGIKLTEIVSLLISDIFDYCGYIRFKGWGPVGWHFQIN